MAFDDKKIDPKILTALMGVIEQVLSKMSGIVPSSAPETKEAELVKYEGRMRVAGMEKFNAPSLISIINYYLTPTDMERRKGVKGALVLYVELENAGKLFKALGFTFPDDEDDVSMMTACGEFCSVLSGNFKKELAGLGYADLAASAPHNYKNSVLEGVEFSTDQKTKHEFSFFYWKHKSIVVELTLAAIPQKK